MICLNGDKQSVVVDTRSCFRFVLIMMTSGKHRGGALLEWRQGKKKS